MKGTRRVETLEISVSVPETLRFLGLHGKKRAPRESLMKEIEEEIAVARDLLEARAVWCARDEGLPGSARFGAGAPLALAVCTIGSALEERVEHLARSGRSTRAMILDAIGSAAAEAAADRSNGRICGEAIRAGRSPGARRSPGYDRWPVAEQRLVFDVLRPEELGVEINEACMMTPRKSVSFAVPLDEAAPRRPGASRCVRCGLAECPYREA